MWINFLGKEKWVGMVYGQLFKPGRNQATTSMNSLLIFRGPKEFWKLEIAKVVSISKNSICNQLNRKKLSLPWLLVEKRDFTSNYLRLEQVELLAYCKKMSINQRKQSQYHWDGTPTQTSSINLTESYIYHSIY